MRKIQIVPNELRTVSRGSRKSIPHRIIGNSIVKLNLNTLIGITYLITLIGIILITFYYSMILTGPFSAGLAGVGTGSIIGYLIGKLIEKLHN